MKKRHLFTAILLFFLSVRLCCPVLYAKDSGLTGEVSVIRTGDDFYVCQIQTENNGQDFEGTVRLAFMRDLEEDDIEDEDIGCVFETPVNLPQGSKKQFTMMIPREELDYQGGSGLLLFLEKSGKVVQKISFENIQEGKLKEIRTGVLCDHFDKLSYLESDDSFILWYYKNHPGQVRLVELDKDNLRDSLDSLHFLIIDSFDMSTLKRQDIVAIENWVNMGGALIVGTGERGEETLSSFDPNFLGLEFVDSSNPPEENQVSHEIATSKLDPYYSYQRDGIDFSKMSVAEIAQTDAFSKRNSRNAILNPGMLCCYGNGCTMVLYYSLCEEEMQKADIVLWYFYDEVMDECWISYAARFGTDESQLTSSMNILEDANTHAPFLFFLTMFLIYIVLAGPFLYLLFAKIKKGEWYCRTVPLFAFCFLGITCLLGESYWIKEPQVCSVTVQQADGNPEGKINTYYKAFNSGKKPWEIKLNDNYLYAGSPKDGIRASAVTDWKYRVVYEDGITLGFNPRHSFESGEMAASGTGKDCGKLQADIPMFSDRGRVGTVTNLTGYDFPYMMVWSDEHMMIIRDVKKGETIDFSQIAGDDRIVWDGAEVSFYELEIQLPWFRGGWIIEKPFTEPWFRKVRPVDEPTEQLAALLAGASDVMNQTGFLGNQVKVCAVVPDYDKTVKSNCREVSYGCLYTVVNQQNSYTLNKPRH